MCDLPCYKCIALPACKNKKYLPDECSLMREYLGIHHATSRNSSLPTFELYRKATLINEYFGVKKIHTSEDIPPFPGKNVDFKNTPQDKLKEYLLELSRIFKEVVHSK